MNSEGFRGVLRRECAGVASGFFIRRLAEAIGYLDT